ncbi:coiled-coil domain containing 164 [Nesidiocoris tenuis]|uniref:Coiled-coil domain containing 164 n=1 Tax=Nesidiocoris tenuis TaxID=355587 RepID=A0ABN7A8A1_9HEMI|nr:coiled-coil domain containing 164 [Nesidiocoris tenuis]
MNSSTHGHRRDPVQVIQTTQIGKKTNDCSVDELKEIKQTQIGVDEGILRELLKQGFESDDVSETLLIADDPEIRKAARRMRIEQGTQESKAVEGDQTNPASPTLVKAQMERSMLKILELLEDSWRSVSNVQIASIKNAIERQNSGKKFREEIDRLIKEECDVTMEKFEGVNSYWKEISRSKSISEICESTGEQMDDCQELLQQKDILIENLKSRLKQADRHFNEELAKRNEFLTGLTERINDQLVVMDDCYRKELQNLQNVVNIEKREFLDERKKLWEKNIGKKELLELENTVKRYDYLQEYEEQLDTMTIEHTETMRDQKMIMENKLNDLAVEESRYQSAILISGEMLNYNVQVLQKRQYENRVIKAQQQRAVNNLQDLVRRLRQEQKNEFQRLVNKKKHLEETIKALHENVNTLHIRLKNLSNINNRKYFQLWDYNQGEAEELISKLMKADKKFYTSLLCVSWHGPQLSFSRQILPSYVEAKALQKEATNGKSSKPNLPDIQAREMRKLCSLIVESIENHTKFLTDDTLKTMLNNVEPTSRTIFFINSLFEVLGLSGRHDIAYLSKFFLPYVYCIQCQDAGRSKDAEGDLAATQDKIRTNADIVFSALNSRFVEANAVVKDEFCCKGAALNLVLGDDHVSPVDITTDQNDDSSMLTHGISKLGKFEQYELPILMTRSPSKLCESDSSGDVGNKSGVEKQLESLSCSRWGHRLGIKDIHVSKALNEFVTQLNSERMSSDSKSLKLTLVQKTIVESRLLKRKDVEEFWRGFGLVFPPKKRLLWKSLLSQMKIYYKILLQIGPPVVRECRAARNR